MGIAAYAARNGHAEGYGSGESKAIDSTGERFLSGNDFISWLGAVTNTTSEEDQEQYKVRNDLRTYGRWFTFDEAWALANAWETGYIDYDGFREVLVNRVSKFSGEYVNAINNADMLSDGTQQLRSALGDMESGIRHNLEVADTRPSDELLSAANNAIAAVDSFNDPISIVENSELLRNAIGYDALVQQYGEDEMALSDAIGAALNGIVESAQTENVMSDNTGVEFTLPQVDELRKAVDLYEKFGAYGYDFVMAATPEYLKKFGIDLEGEGLTASLEEYMDELTEGAWRDAYASDGLGFVGTVNAGLVKGYQGVGNAVAGGSRMIRDVLDFLPGVTAYEEGDGSYYDRVQSVSGKVDERLATKATSFEQFAAQIVSETTRNQLTGALGAALGNMANAGKFSKQVSSAVQKAASGGTVSASGVAQLMNAAAASKSAIDTAEIIARTPFGSVMFPGSATIKRAATGIKSVQQGYAETTGGRVKFVTGEPNAAKYAAAAIGGVNVLPQSKDYVYGFDDALGSNQSQKFKTLVNAGLDPSLAWNSARGTANAKTQTTAANETLSDDEATAKEIQETQSAARTSREEAGMPMDVAPWAVTDGQGADESTPTGAGIALWRKYGLYTYPQTLESDAANEEYRKAYNMIVKSYLGGAYGETGTRAAAEKLETALRKARSKAKAKYSAEEEMDEGGDLDGQK